MSVLAETIEAQPELLVRVLALDLDAGIEQLRRADRIWLVGTGTSQHAAEIGASMLEGAGRDARWRSAATFARFGPRLGSGDAVVIVSHTAQTAFAQRSRTNAISVGAGVVSITGVGSGWPEAIETVPRERSETYTASYTAALLVLARLASALGATEITPEALAAMPEVTRAALALDSNALAMAPYRVFVIAGIGGGAVTAREGALKLREAARVLSEGYEGEYLLHGSAVPLDQRDFLLLLAPERDPDGLLSAIGQAAAAEGVTVVSLSAPQELPYALAQIPLTVQLQQLACRLADANRLNPDAVITGGWSSDTLWSAGGP
jgi:glutamine---fructose-6-phosphate transaminase (isomerizing)